MAHRLTDTAERQIEAVLLESARHHGLEAASRYSRLILTVMAALGDEPGRVGAIEIPNLAGIRAYPARLARLHVEPSQRVGKPRHLVVYRVAPDGVVEVLGLVHDRMVLSRRARDMLQRGDEG